MKTMRDECDCLGGCTKHARLIEGGSNLVLLDPDVAELFPDSASVNEALRLLAKLAQRQTERAAG